MKRNKKDRNITFKVRTKKDKNKFWTIAVLAVVLMGIAGATLSIFVQGMPMNESEFKECSEVGQQVYQQIRSGNIIVPTGYTYEHTSTQISIRKDHRTGSATAILREGELEFDHNDEMARMIILNVMGSLVSMIFTWFIVEAIARWKKMK